MNGTTYEHIDLSSLIEDQRIKTTESLKASIEAYQEEILNRLPVDWSHAGTYPKELVTSIGRVSLTVIRMKRPAAQGGGTISPILDALSIRRKKYSDELRMSLASKASRMSYGDAQKDFQESSRLVVPKTTIHSFVQEVGSRLADVATTTAAAIQKKLREQQIVLASKESKLSRRQHRRRMEREEEIGKEEKVSSVVSWQKQLVVVMAQRPRASIPRSIT